MIELGERPESRVTADCWRTIARSTIRRDPTETARAIVLRNESVGETSVVRLGRLVV